MGIFENYTLASAQISKSIKKITSIEMTEFDLKNIHVSCIYYLYKRNKLTSKELIYLCNEDKAAISRGLDQLKKKGYVKSEVASKIRRYKKNFLLTDEGITIGEKIASKVDKIIKVAKYGVKDEELDSFYRILSIIANNLQRHSDELEDKLV